MRKLLVDDLRPGAMLARPVYDLKGVLMLGAGVVLDEERISTLRKRGIPAVYVEEPGLEDLQPREFLSGPTLARAIGVLRPLLSSLEKGEGGILSASVPDLQELARRMAEDLRTTPLEGLNLLGAALPEEYLLNHSLDVAFLAGALALSRGEREAEAVILGGLLHDLGLAVSGAWRRRPLSEDGRRQYDSHPVVGFRLLQDLREISAFAKVAVLQHHERRDGSGFPAGVGGDKLHRVAETVGLADAYVLMVEREGFSSRRLLPHEALEYLMSTAGFEFHHELVESFLRLINPYPEGSRVRLSSGEEGFVVGRTGIPTRPLLRVIGDGGFRDLDLAVGGNQTKLIVELL